MREQSRMRHGSHQMTTLVLAHKNDTATLEPCAVVVWCALVNKLYFANVSCEWVSCQKFKFKDKRLWSLVSARFFYHAHSALLIIVKLIDLDFTSKVLCMLHVLFDQLTRINPSIIYSMLLWTHPRKTKNDQCLHRYEKKKKCCKSTTSNSSKLHILPRPTSQPR